jgi:hypothetical protein
MTVAPHLAGRMAPLYEPFEYFVDAKAAADFPMTSRKHVRWRVRVHSSPPLDPTSQKKEWRFLLSELREYMLKCRQRPPEHKQQGGFDAQV